jgi:spore maturation protein CgeB
VPRYDLVLTYGGGEPVRQAYLGLGARDCVPIYNALDPSTHFPVPPEPRFEGDLGFLGNRLPDREARVEEFFLRAAAQLPERACCWAAAAGATSRCRPTCTTWATSTPPTTTPSTARRSRC